MLRASLITVLLTALAGCAGEMGDGEVIGPRGGMIESDDGQLTVEIPENALADEMAISLTATACADPTAFACYDFDPWGVMLAAPAWVVFDPGDSQMDATELRLNVEGADGLVPMSDANYDPEAGTAWATVLFLTSITVEGS